MSQSARAPQPPSSLPSPQRVSARMLSSLNSTLTTPPIGTSITRTEKRDQYRAIAEHEPWGLKVKEEYEGFLGDQRKKAETERKKREAFRVGLEKQMMEASKRKKEEEKVKREDASREQQLYASYRKILEDEKKKKRERFLKQVQEREDHMHELTALREKAFQEELEVTQSHRAMDDGMHDKAQEAASARRRRQMKINQEMVEAKEVLNARKRQQLELEMALDKKSFEEQTRREQAELQRRKDQVKRRQQIVDSNAAKWDLVRKEQDEFSQKQQERIEAERQAQISRAEAKDAAFASKRKEATKFTKSFLVSQIEAHDKRKKLRSDELKNERALVDTDTARFYEDRHNLQSRQRERNLNYGDELARQMQSQHDRQLDQIISVPRIR